MGVEPGSETQWHRGCRQVALVGEPAGWRPWDPEGCMKVAFPRSKNSAKLTWVADFQFSRKTGQREFDVKSPNF